MAAQARQRVDARNVFERHGITEHSPLRFDERVAINQDIWGYFSEEVENAGLSSGSSSSNDEDTDTYIPRPPLPRQPPSKHSASTVARLTAEQEAHVAASAPSKKRKGKAKAAETANKGTGKFLASSTPLHEAAARNDVAELKRLIDEEEASVNGSGRFGQTALHVAARAGAINSIALLLQYRADFNIRDDDGATPLHCAAQDGQAEAVQALLAAGADAERIHRRRGLTVFGVALAEGRTDVVRVLLGFKAVVPPLALHTCARIRDSETAQLMLAEHNASASAEDKDGNTALHVAAAYNALDVAWHLIMKGADINKTRAKDLWTPLHCAVNGRSTPVALLLLDKGAQADLRSTDGETARDIAKAKGLTAEFIEVLADAENGVPPPRELVAKLRFATIGKPAAAKRSVAELAKSGAVSSASKQSALFFKQKSKGKAKAKAKREKTQKDASQDDEQSSASDAGVRLLCETCGADMNRKCVAATSSAARTNAAHRNGCVICAKKPQGGTPKPPAVGNTDSVVGPFLPVVDRTGAPVRPYRIAVVTQALILAGRSLNAYAEQLALRLRESGKGEHLAAIRKEIEASTPQGFYFCLPKADVAALRVPSEAYVRDPSRRIAGDHGGLVKLTGTDLRPYVHDIVALLRVSGATEERVSEVYAHFEGAKPAAPRIAAQASATTPKKPVAPAAVPVNAQVTAPKPKSKPVPAPKAQTGIVTTIIELSSDED